MGPKKTENGRKRQKLPCKVGSSAHYAPKRVKTVKKVQITPKKSQKRPKSVQRFGLEDFTNTRDITEDQKRPKMVQKRQKLLCKVAYSQNLAKKPQKRAKMHPKVANSGPNGQKY